MADAFRGKLLETKETARGFHLTEETKPTSVLAFLDTVNSKLDSYIENLTKLASTIRTNKHGASHHDGPIMEFLPSKDDLPKFSQLLSEFDHFNKNKVEETFDSYANKIGVADKMKIHAKVSEIEEKIKDLDRKILTLKFARPITTKKGTAEYFSTTLASLSAMCFAIVGDSTPDAKAKQTKKR